MIVQGVPVGGLLVKCWLVSTIVVVLCLMCADDSPAQTQPPREPYVTLLTLEAMNGKQVVLDTELGQIIVDLRPDLAPNHVGLIMQLAEEGEYDGTIFHRMVRHGIVQGGDPITKDFQRTDVYGRGGLNLVAAEFSGAKHVRGTVSAVLIPGQVNSGGAQFFICVVDQPSLDSQHTIWGQVAEGMDVVTRISETPVDSEGRATQRVTIRAVTIRDAPPPEAVPFTIETDAELAAYRAIVETDRGSVAIDFYPDRAPNHVRNFLRLAEAGVYDGMAFHRVVRDFVIQSGHLPTRREPLTERQQRFVRSLAPEFNDTPHVKGIVSMARLEDPASASTSFFICIDVAEELDGQYTAFGVVVEGLDVLDAIAAVPTEDEVPLERIGIRNVRVVRR